MSIWAVGKLGQPVRIILQGELSSANLQCGDGEVVALLNRMPFEPVMITADGKDVVAIPLTLEELKSRAWSDSKGARDIELTNSFNNFDINMTSMTKLNTAVLSALIAKTNGQSFSVLWTMADNTVKELDADALLAAAQGIKDHVDAIYQKYQKQRDSINAATTVEELETLSSISK